MFINAHCSLFNTVEFLYGRPSTIQAGSCVTWWSATPSTWRGQAVGCIVPHSTGREGTGTNWLRSDDSVWQVFRHADSMDMGSGIQCYICCIRKGVDAWRSRDKRSLYNVLLDVAGRAGKQCLKQHTIVNCSETEECGLSDPSFKCCYSLRVYLRGSYVCESTLPIWNNNVLPLPLDCTGPTCINNWIISRKKMRGDKVRFYLRVASFTLSFSKGTSVQSERTITFAL